MQNAAVRDFPLPGMLPRQEPIEPPATFDLSKTEDVLKCGDLEYAVISFVCPPQANSMALKIRGAFATEAEACRAAKQIAAVDPFFDGEF